jgi:hypothetical protein
MNGFLPSSWFTFRCWEALSIFDRTFLESTPFYPLQELTMEEEGDLGHGTWIAEKRISRWATDRFGFRNEPWSEVPDVVMTGDSFVIGSGVSQEDIFSEQLSDLTGLKVVNMAKASIRDILDLKVFEYQKPKWVILGVVERELPSVPFYLLKSENQYPDWRNEPLMDGIIFWDKILKAVPLRKCRASVFQFIADGIYHRWNRPSSMSNKHLPLGMIPANDPQEAYLFGSKNRGWIPREKLFHSVSSLHELHSELLSLGINFLFCPFPDKETAYSERLDVPDEPRNLDTVEQLCEQYNVPMVNPLPALKQAAHKESIYYRDDTHFNPRGIRITAKEISAQMDQ